MPDGSMDAEMDGWMIDYRQWMKDIVNEHDDKATHTHISNEVLYSFWSRQMDFQPFHL